MKDPVWIRKSVVRAMHDILLAEYGGAPGIRDEALLESALARPLNQLAYDRSNLFGLAAAYVNGILRNHPFMDGNKRTAFLTGYALLQRNGRELVAGEPEATQIMFDLSQKKVTEETFPLWLEEHCHPRTRR